MELSAWHWLLPPCWNIKLQNIKKKNPKKEIWSTDSDPVIRTPQSIQPTLKLSFELF